MQQREQLDIQGRLTIQFVNARGEVERTMEVSNMIVNTGRNLVASLFAGKGGKFISHVAVGKNGAETAASDTKLGEEVFRKELTVQSPVLIQVDGKDRYKVALSAELGLNEPTAAEVVLQEAALFNGLAAADTFMYNRVKFPPVTKTKDFKLTLFWEIIF